ncbi:MAG: putative toxin-antitoxin system toxin component, PIN family [Anaerolineae bacterium]|nr:putative toxin-antitoxin system toxin component, PIN family [Anaerolineae bacterium]
MSVNKIKAVIDTQIFLRAAINLKSLPGKLIFSMRGSYNLVASDAIKAEVQDVLYRPKIRDKFPHLTDEIAQIVLTAFEDAEIVEPANVPAISRDPKDDIFLACAKAASANYIVSEDKDLLVLNPYETIQIVNAIDFLRVLQSD